MVNAVKGIGRVRLPDINGRLYFVVVIRSVNELYSFSYKQKPFMARSIVIYCMPVDKQI